MSLLPNKPGYNPKIELNSKKCIDMVLQPLSDHVTIKINGSLTSEDIFGSGAKNPNIKAKF